MIRLTQLQNLGLQKGRITFKFDYVSQICITYKHYHVSQKQEPPGGLTLTWIDVINLWCT